MSLTVALALAAAVATARAYAEVLLPPDPAVALGRTVPFEGFVDESGRPFSAADAASDGRPWIVSPIYTRCLHTCSPITNALRAALAAPALTARDYRVVSFSFDPGETGEGLRRFRDRMQLPAEWSTLRAGDAGALERTLAALDFRTITVGPGEIEHPNLVAILAPDRRLAEYVFGVNPTAAALRAALARARTGATGAGVERHLLGVAAIGFVVSTLVFTALLVRRAGARRAASRARA